jgi:diguanylate cyclase (GGDEF)-like protein
VQLDSFTLLAAGSSLLALLGVVFFFVWLRHRSTPALLWWSFPFVFGGAAALVYLRPHWETDFIIIAVGNAARIFAVGCLWQGVRVFEGRKPALGRLLAVCLLWVGLCCIPDFVTSMLARVVGASAFVGALCAIAAYEIWRNRQEALASRWPAFAVFASFAALMVLRIAVAPWAPFPMGVGPVDSVWLGIFLWLVFGHSTCAAVFFLAMTLERREAQQRSFAMALLVLDLDHFKLVNDRHGHDVGDRLLKAFAEVSEASVRPSDHLFRMGGEEFCFVLPETSLKDAIEIAERIRAAVAASPVDTERGPATATVSIGIAATQFAIDVEVLLAAADAAVYEAKARGRNRVVVAEPSSLVRLQTAEPPRRLRA